MCVSQQLVELVQHLDTQLAPSLTSRDQDRNLCTNVGCDRVRMAIPQGDQRNWFAIKASDLHAVLVESQQSGDANMQNILVDRMRLHYIQERICDLHRKKWVILSKQAEGTERRATAHSHVCLFL
ncbi:unnamed protein product [Polarella glacialis]|uniref:Uncharacterized protein n=1 Tax=Polarella glacialis TaxID=89957 RepID=A0A813EPX7_POLGL|nr:unnamed protein product [Polarella glacialis]CAE8646012.1 unnamed protein product [Polarella glacialis]